MESENIEGVATDPNGSPLQDAVIALFLTNKNASDGDVKNIKYARTDSNGKYVIKNHPDADGTSQEWHVAGYYEDGTGEFNALSKPSVSASVGLTIPDSDTVQYQYDARLLNGFSDGNAVSSWTDQRVSGVTVSGQATYRSSVINGNPALEHDGVDDGFTSNQTTLSRPIGLVAVVDVDSIPSDIGEIIGVSDDISDRLLLSVNNGSWIAFGGGSAISGSSDTSIQLLTVYASTNQETILREEGTETGRSEGDDDFEAYEAVSVGKRGASDSIPFRGNIGFAEIHQGLTLTELQQREQEVADYWGISLS